MIDNAAHDILIRAADEVGWDEMSMLLLATRFIARLNCEDPTVLEKLEAYLEEQVAEESAPKPRAASASPRPCRRP